MSSRSKATSPVPADKTAPAKKVVAKKAAPKKAQAKKAAATKPASEGMPESTPSAAADARPLSKKLKRSIKALGAAAQDYLVPLIKKHGAEVVAIGVAQVAAQTKNRKLRAALLLISPALLAIKPKDGR